MSTVTMPMSEKKNEPEYCVYGSLKADKDIIRLVKIAALTDEKSVQEWVSDALNEMAAKSINRKPVKRKPPKP